MGVCSSCLGLRKKDDSEHQRLLPADPSYSSHLYTHAPFPPSPSGPTTLDPQAVLQEREYLDRLVAQTSENLIDIFAPPLLTSSTTPNTRGEWYRSVLDKTEPPEEGGGFEIPVVLDPGVVGREEREWLDDVLRKGEEAVKSLGRVKGVGRLVVGLEVE